MVLTVVIGSSGSGKTTFLNDTTKSHKCTYIRQYHSVRPYVTVSKIPNFDPTKLPFWDIYVREKKDGKIKVGGTMAGEFTAGLSGGQRKLLLFELICQRAAGQTDLLLVLDEPFAGVTDDFVPFIVSRLNELRRNHNILLVTNDHVETLKAMADNTITVSAIDRSTVSVNQMAKVDREKVILALSVGDEYVYKASAADLKFFWDVEIANNGALLGVVIFTTVSFAFFLATFWNSTEESTVLVVIAGGIIAFFCLNPYLLSLVDWRTYMCEEAEALLHASKSANKLMKTLLTMLMVLIVSIIEYGIVNAVLADGLLTDFKFWVAMLMDSSAMMIPFVFLGLYTKLPSEAVDMFGSMPFLFMIFFSTTFSPGSGVPALKELRYLFTRFYFWCFLPGVEDQMEGCPADDVVVLYMCLSAFVGLALFLIYKGIKQLMKWSRTKKDHQRRTTMKADKEFAQLQMELFGDNNVAPVNDNMDPFLIHDKVTSQGNTDFNNSGATSSSSSSQHDDEEYLV